MYVKYDERAIQGSALVGQIFATRRHQAHMGDCQNTISRRSYKQTLNIMMRFGCSLRHEAARRVNHTFSRVALDSR